MFSSEDKCYLENLFKSFLLQTKAFISFVYGIENRYASVELNSLKTEKQGGILIISNKKKR